MKYMWIECIHAAEYKFNLKDNNKSPTTAFIISYVIRVIL